MTIAKRTRAWAAGLLLGMGLAAAAGADGTARFEVTDEVVNPDLQPFTATIATVGNGSSFIEPGSGFEPNVFRNLVYATEDAADRVHAAPKDVSGYDMWRSGAFDGAEIDVFRIENGAFRHVRRDRVAEGGHHASGWIEVTGREVAAPDATRFLWSWGKRFRPGVPYWFTIRAVDAEGRVSAPAAAVSVEKPQAGEKRRRDLPNDTVPLKGPTEETNPALGAPENLAARVTADGVVELTWDPADGPVAGYRVFRSDYPPEAQRGYFFDLAGDGAPIRKGDLVMIRKKFYAASREALASNRIWGASQAQSLAGKRLLNGFSDEAENGRWELRPHDEGTPVAEPGETYLHLSVDRGRKARIGNWTHAGTGQDWYPVLQPGRSYRMEVWLRGASEGPVTFEMDGSFTAPDGRELGIPPVQFQVTPEWRRYQADIVVPGLDRDRRPGRTQLVLKGPAEVDVDNFRLYRADAPWLDLLPEKYDQLAASGMGMLRTHAFIKTGTQSYDLQQLTNPGGVIEGVRGGNTLPQTLALMAQAGVDPWLQVEMHFSREEWLGLAEYLAAPYDPATDSPETKPWAAKRRAQGHPAPWIDDFDEVWFEISNETWNPIFAPWVFNPMRDAATGERYSAGAVYGLYQEYVLGILRQSPYWPALEEKLVPVLGGRNGAGYGMEAARVSPSSDYLTYAAYVGGWDEAEGPTKPSPPSFFSMLTHVNQAAIPRARQQEVETAELAAARGRPLRLGTYEAGPGYALRGAEGKLTEAESTGQEKVKKSLAAGTATLDSFLARAVHGFRSQNFFLFEDGIRWSSHARWEDGGHAYPSWAWLAFFNNELRGDLLGVETVAVPTADLEKGRRRRPVDDAPLVAAYATRGDDRLSVILVSRKIPGQPGSGEDGRTAVTVDLPIEGAERLTVHRMSGDYDDDNVAAETVRLEAETLEVPATLPRLEVPVLEPGETLVYVFDGLRE